MEITYLRTVLYLARLKSFSKTAIEIPCSQSTVSRHVKMVEDELGMVLFRRSKNTNTVELTEYGEEKLPLIENIVNSYERLTDVSFIMRKKPELTMAVPRNAFWSMVKAYMVAQFYQRYPHIALKIIESRENEASELLDSGDIDAFLLRRIYHKNEVPDENWHGSKLQVIQAADVNLHMGVGLINPLSNSKGVCLEDLRDQTFIFTKQYNTVSSLVYAKNLFVEACKDAGFTPQILTVTDDQDARILDAINGKGIIPFLLPRPMRHYPGAHFIPVKNAPYYARFYLCCGVNRRQEVAALIDFMTDYMDTEKIVL